MEASALTSATHSGLLVRRSPLWRLQGDERLVALIRDGQDLAFEVLFDRYQSRLLAFCRHMVGSSQDAEDVLQEVFAAAHSAMLADTRPINARPWLYRIARNRCLNHLRRPAAEAQDSMDVHPHENGTSTHERVQRREELREIVADVQELPETQRTALVLREIDDLSYTEIAQAMGTTMPAVKSLLVRARMSLAEASEARILTCDEVRLELAEAAEGLCKLSPPSRRHVRDCESCSRFRGQLRSSTKALAATLAPLGLLSLLRKLFGAKLGGGSAGGGSAGGGSAGGGSAGGVAGSAGGVAGSAGGVAGSVGGVAAATGGSSALGSAAVAAGSAVSGIGGALGAKAAVGMATAALITAGTVGTEGLGSNGQRASAPTASSAASGNGSEAKGETAYQNVLYEQSDAAPASTWAPEAPPPPAPAEHIWPPAEAAPPAPAPLEPAPEPAPIEPAPIEPAALPELPLPPELELPIDPAAPPAEVPKADPGTTGDASDEGGDGAIVGATADEDTGGIGIDSLPASDPDPATEPSDPVADPSDPTAGLSDPVEVLPSDPVEVLPSDPVDVLPPDPVEVLPSDPVETLPSDPAPASDEPESSQSGSEEPPPATAS